MNHEEYNSKINFPRIARNFDPLRAQWHLLYDLTTKRPIACSTMYGTINGLAQRYTNSIQWFNVHSTLNMFGNVKVDSGFKPANCWEWKFNLKTRVFDHMPGNMSFDELYANRINVEKAATMDRLIAGVNSFRRPFLRDILDQAHVYDLKVEEARSIVDNNIRSITEDEFPFVSDYAASIGCEPQVAALDILSRADYQKEAYRRSEAFRMKYAKAIYNAKEIVELRAILSDIDKELLPYSKI